jgi:hypothetical protein
VEAPSFVPLTDFRTAGVGVPAGTVQLTDHLPLSVNFRVLQWAAGPAHFHVRTPHVVWDARALDHDPVLYGMLEARPARHLSWLQRTSFSSKDKAARVAEQVQEEVARAVEKVKNA